MYMSRGVSFLRTWSQARRFRKLPADARSIVFYAENGDAWPHFEPIVRELTDSMGRSICYATSCPRDPILRAADPHIRAFCIGEGMIRTWWFLSLAADVLVMTMPDLQTFHLKRSQAWPVHYCYVFHSMVSTHMIYRRGAFDHYDSILCTGPHHLREIRATEAASALKPKQLVEHGYGRLDTMLRQRATGPKMPRGADEPVRVLVAPSWGPRGLLETHGIEVCRVLLDAGFHVTVRPHPMTGYKWPEAIRAIETTCGGRAGFVLERDIGSCESLAAADVMVSDWSGAALEFAFGYERPVLFVDVPRKVNNPQYERIGVEPLEVSIRPQIGEILSPDRLAEMPTLVRRMAREQASYQQRIREARGQSVFNLGKSGAAAAHHIAAVADAACHSRRQTTESAMPDFATPEVA